MSVDIANRLDDFRDLLLSGRLSKLSATEILSLAVKFSKIESEYVDASPMPLLKKRIAVLSSSTSYHLVRVLRLFLYEQGIHPEFYEGEYNGIVAELMRQDSGVYAFNPDILLLMPSVTDIKDYPELFSGNDKIESWLDCKIRHYVDLWSAASKMEGCHILQSLFVAPIGRQLGQLEANYPFSRSQCLMRLNAEFVKRRPASVTLLDFDHIASHMGKRAWFDESTYHLSKQPFSIDAFVPVCRMVARNISTQFGRVNKCLVLDLDNTLWGGVVGDDGMTGILLDPNNALGEAFLAFQDYVRLLKDRGVILAVCSKNDEEIAKRVFTEHPAMRLRLEDIACFVANWDDKASNLRRIAAALNIGLDAIVFVDDNPAEREIVRRFVPDVEVIDLPEDPSFFIRTMEESLCFEWAQVSREDVSRVGTYVADSKRADLQSRSLDYDDYLRSLDMSARLGKITDMEAPRFCQLINKSNQFNLRTQRYTEAAVNRMRMSAEDYALLHVSLKDRFDDYGLICAVILRKDARYAFIDTWVMSCRVLRRGVEHLMFNHLCDVAKRWDCDRLVGEYIPTEKNKLVSGLLSSLSFEAVPGVDLSLTDAMGDRFEFQIDRFVEREHHIKMEHMGAQPLDSVDERIVARS